MEMQEPERYDTRSHLFTLRLWLERLDGGRSEWRGELHHVLSDEIRYFRHCAGLVELLEAMLAELEESDRPNQAA